MLPDLSLVLSYKHQPVIRSYMRTFAVDDNKARELFNDMLCYLWLYRKHVLDRQEQPKNKALQFQFVMHEEMRDIDNMWHNFILYTQDYTNFCNQTFGGYLHHMPDIADAIVQTHEEFVIDLEKFLSYVYDHLGEATVNRWFARHVTSS